MAKIISVIEVAQQRDLGKKVDEDKLNNAIDLVQGVEMYDMLGDFLFDVIKGAETAPYQELMDGSEFTYQGYTYIHEGLKAVMIDLTYARYLSMINQNVTPFGVVNKVSQDSNPTDPAIIKNMVHMAQSDADAKFRVVKIYLEANRETFKRYFIGGESGPQLNTFNNNWSII